MIPIEPIAVQHVATSIRIGIPDYVVGEAEHEAVVLFVDDRDAVVRVERVKIPSTQKMGSDNAIVDFVCRHLNIITTKSNLHQ